MTKTHCKIAVNMVQYRKKNIYRAAVQRQKRRESHMTRKTQVAVIGAGHAGIEAALAAARMGADTVLFTLNLDSLANLPCNPSIGGTGKGHLVYEIDALGGEMGRAADAVTLQSRTLNLGKGAAVHSKRVQADRMLYRAVMKATVEKTEGLRLIQAHVTEILTEDTSVLRALKPPLATCGRPKRSFFAPALIFPLPSSWVT